MYQNNNNIVKITINLNNGVYIFSCKSATGKTRLAKELRQLQLGGKPVSSYTYNDKLMGIPIERCLNPEYKVILLDRYDMYKDSSIVELMKQYSESSIILVDFKSPESLGVKDCKFCGIEMTANSIEVIP